MNRLDDPLSLAKKSKNGKAVAPLGERAKLFTPEAPAELNMLWGPNQLIKLFYEQDGMLCIGGPSKGGRTSCLRLLAHYAHSFGGAKVVWIDAMALCEEGALIRRFANDDILAARIIGELYSGRVCRYLSELEQLLSEWVCTMGMPVCIVVDNADSLMTVNVFKKLATLAEKKLIKVVVAVRDERLFVNKQVGVSSAAKSIRVPEVCGTDALKNAPVASLGEPPRTLRWSGYEVTQ